MNVEKVNIIKKIRRKKAKCHNYSSNNACKSITYLKINIYIYFSLLLEKSYILHHQNLIFEFFHIQISSNRHRYD